MVPREALPAGTQPGSLYVGPLSRGREGSDQRMLDGSGTVLSCLSSSPGHSLITTISGWEVRIWKTRVGPDTESQVSLLRLRENHKMEFMKGPARPQAASWGVGGQQQRIWQGPTASCWVVMRGFLSQIPRILPAVPFACGLCSLFIIPDSASLLNGPPLPSSCSFTSGARREHWNSPRGLELTAVFPAFSERASALRFWNKP